MPVRGQKRMRWKVLVRSERKMHREKSMRKGLRRWACLLLVFLAIFAYIQMLGVRVSRLRAGIMLFCSVAAGGRTGPQYWCPGDSLGLRRSGGAGGAALGAAHQWFLAVFWRHRCGDHGAGMAGGAGTGGKKRRNCWNGEDHCRRKEKSWVRKIRYQKKVG